MKASMNVIVPYLYKRFNIVFQKIKLPKSWNQSKIVPIHKEGDINNPDIYPPISLISILSNVFTNDINTRLTRWANLHNLIAEEQAGFRNNYSTCDNIFILYHVIQKYLRNRKLYVLFVEYKRLSTL